MSNRMDFLIFLHNCFYSIASAGYLVIVVFVTKLPFHRPVLLILQLELKCSKTLEAWWCLHKQGGLTFHRVYTIAYIIHTT